MEIIYFLAYVFGINFLVALIDSYPKNKYYVISGVIVTLLSVLYFTNPSEVTHEQKLQKELKLISDFKYLSDSELSEFTDSLISVKDFKFFSVTENNFYDRHIHNQSCNHANTKYVGIGFLNNVFYFVNPKTNKYDIFIIGLFTCYILFFLFRVF